MLYTDKLERHFPNKTVDTHNKKKLHIFRCVYALKLKWLMEGTKQVIIIMYEEKRIEEQE